MEEDLHEYHGKDIEVSYDHNRCIHVRECAEGLSGVFNPSQRPWIDADNADAGEVARVIERCPTGALHYERTDDGVPEHIPSTNTVTTTANGPLYLHGDIVIRSNDEVVLEDTRVGLCRCGHTMNELLCDNSHTRVFEAEGNKSADPAIGENIEGKYDEEGDTADTSDGEDGNDQPDGKLVVTPTPNGPLILDGIFELWNGGGKPTRHDEAAFCRCGGSANKPFCDGTHGKIGFTTNAEE
ncbi:CDGSH iron-sulfur domain-containing protein [Haladaptatus pallidirubidus]|uniref:CDGSH iron-sulfur domain-containing protein n=1 Tax=Haladaptatus pallidirubidus TaxID=1008152 RepID=A0AAV3URS7_9EURY|nr:CDGSH iron-sulfur domain-containing protein [Haladaptatus pallidirubidus]